MLGEVLLRLRARYPELELRGLGGAAAAAYGLEPLLPLERTAVSGAWDVLRRPFFILRMYRMAVAAMEGFRPDLVLLVDYPGLNLRLARRARALGLDVHFIAPPQAWAYRNPERRARRAAEALEGCSVHVLFPFEAAAFAAHARKVTVGHFLVTETPSRPGVAKILCLCPGSRLPVLRRNLPLWLHRLDQLQGLAGHGDAAPPGPIEVHILVPAHLEGEATSLVRAFLVRRVFSARRAESAGNTAPVPRVRTDKDEALAEARWAIAFPGTIALELALRRVPALILAVLDPLTLAIGKRILASTDRLGLPNLLLREDLFPEWAGTAAKLTREAMHGRMSSLLARKPAWDGAWEAILGRLEKAVGTGNGAEICARECLDTLETAWDKVKNRVNTQVTL